MKQIVLKTAVSERALKDEAKLQSMYIENKEMKEQGLGCCSWTGNGKIHAYLWCSSLHACTKTCEEAKDFVKLHSKK